MCAGGKSAAFHDPIAPVICELSERWCERCSKRVADKCVDVGRVNVERVDVKRANIVVVYAIGSKAAGSKMFVFFRYQ